MPKYASCFDTIPSVYIQCLVGNKNIYVCVRVHGWNHIFGNLHVIYNIYTSDLRIPHILYTITKIILVHI